MLTSATQLSEADVDIRNGNKSKFNCISVITNNISMIRNKITIGI